MAIFSKKSSEKSIIWGALFFIGITIAGFVMGIMGLTGNKVSLSDAFANGLNRGDIVSGVPEYGIDHYALKVKHTVRGIPVGNDYYFYIVDGNDENAFVVRAPKNFGKNFDGEYKNAKNVRIKGKVKRMDYKVRNSLSEGGAYAGDYYIDLLSNRMAVMWLGAGIAGLFTIILFIVTNIKKKNDEFFEGSTASKVMNGAMAGGFIIVAVLVIYVLAHM
jgi:hypothetical protein